MPEAPYSDRNINKAKNLHSLSKLSSDKPKSQKTNHCDKQFYAAIDLGTNNCRLMIAKKTGNNLEIIESFSRIVRLGEGLGKTGQLEAKAMQRALGALKICSEKISKRSNIKIKAVATQACRIAKNGLDFINQVKNDIGIDLKLISTEEEAHLALMGCTSLLVPSSKLNDYDSAMVIDIGGGSTEICWIRLDKYKDFIPNGELISHHIEVRNFFPKPDYFISIPIGVVTLSEVSEEPESDARRAWFMMMRDVVIKELHKANPPIWFLNSIKNNRNLIVGTSGAITSLAGLHLGLQKYDRSQVDGLWLTKKDCCIIIDRLLSQNKIERAKQGCIGADRVDLVLSGAAILEAVQTIWPTDKLIVADRGLREGLLLSIASKKNRRRRRKKINNKNIKNQTD